MIFSYYSLINNIRLLQVDANFTAALVANFKLLRLVEGETLYREDDLSTESTLLKVTWANIKLVYFVSKGAVKFVTEAAEGIYCLTEGTYFGEVEMIEGVIYSELFFH